MEIKYILSGESELATVVGLSTEGYEIASKLIQNGVETIVVDENLQMGMKLTSEVASSHISVSDLFDGEMLVGLIPMGTAISKANFIFFTPKIRKTNQEARSEINTRFRDTIKNLSKNSTIFFCLPAGFNENRANISLIERMSGLQLHEGFEYIYLPLGPSSKTTKVMGLEKKADEKTLGILKHAGIRPPQSTTFEASETLYFRRILAKYVSIAIDLEVYKRIADSDERRIVKRISGYKEVYLDTITENLFDLRLVLGTLDTGDPSLYLTSGILKSIDGYAKYLVDGIRQIMREKELKASKTRIIISWSIDKYEMRGDRLSVLDSIKDRLHDYIGDVNILSKGEYVTQSGLGITRIMPDINKVGIVVICSEKDKDYASKVFNLNDRDPSTLALNADLLVDQIE